MKQKLGLLPPVPAFRVLRCIDVEHPTRSEMKHHFENRRNRELQGVRKK